MVKQQLWIINSSFVCIALLCLGAHFLLSEEAPIAPSRRRVAIDKRSNTPRVVVNIEKILTNDLFDTFTAAPEKTPTAKNLATPIPELSVKSSGKPPEQKKPQFMPPLDIKLKGIIMSDDPGKSMAMIADQTGKEQSYSVGDRIQDGQIIKISKNKLVVIRNNGQQETFSLRKQENFLPGVSSWDLAIKKVDDSLYHVNPLELTKAITSVGEVIEALDLCGAHKDGASIGVFVGSIKHHPLGEKLGLREGDIITSVNGLTTNTAKDRIAIYDTIAALPMGSLITVSLTRSDKPMELSYLLKKIEAPSPFAQPETEKQPGAQEPEENLFKLGQNAQRQQRRKRFEQVHRTAEQHDNAIADMRKRMVDDMKIRAQNRRVV